LTKRSRNLVIMAVVIMLVPTLVLAGGHKFSIGQPVAGEDNTIVVPLLVTNVAELSGMDIPLKFSEGVNLKEVIFKDTRVDYFDLKAAAINNDQHTVVLGLLPQMSPTYKPKLEAGSGEVARLVFEVEDANVNTVTIEPTEMDNPRHALTYVVFNPAADGTPGNTAVAPEFTGTTVALSGVGGDGLPDAFALSQNYPNPFNPATNVAFDLPVAAHVELVVFNVLGQKVATLIDGDMEAGSHVVEFDGSVVSSGVYFYRLTAGDFSETKKMMLLK